MPDHCAATSLVPIAYSRRPYVVRLSSSQITTAVGGRRVGVPTATSSGLPPPPIGTDRAAEKKSWIGWVLIGCWSLMPIGIEEKAGWVASVGFSAREPVSGS